jgi:hypothetical protein
MDGLAVQVALRDPDVPEALMSRLWLEAAAAEVGVPAGALVPTRRRSAGRRGTAR